MIKVALLGKGKTGSKVIELCENSTKYKLTVFDSINKPTKSSIKGHDVVLSFLTGDVFIGYLPLLTESGIPVVTGSTGLKWTKENINLVESTNTAWIFSNNFSLGMTIAKEMINILGQASQLFNDVNFNIHEIHHTEKKDGPSGTANAWKEWLDQDAKMTFDRIGDVVGTHELTLSTSYENITMKHEATDRKVFAEGALWACTEILKLPKGLHDFSNVAKSVISKG